MAKREKKARYAGLSELDRRSFIRNGSLLLVASPALRTYTADSPGTEPAVKFGIMTDLHYADKPPGGTRHYRKTLSKLAVAAEELAKYQPDFVVELGDFVDAAEDVETEKTYVQTIHRQFEALPGENHYVLGNHCVYSLTKHEFLEIVGQTRPYYSFNRGGFRFIVLDACFRHDGVPYGRKNYDWTDANIPASELQWLRAELKRASQPTILFVHQRLDVGGHYGVKNAAEVRGVLEQSHQVLAVFQGHHHKNDHQEISGIHYYTLGAMVEGAETKQNVFATVDVYPKGAIRVTGYFDAKDFFAPSPQ